MKILIFVILSLFFCLALTQTPSNPVWPNSFSATIVHTRSDDPRPNLFRYFYDFTAAKDRLDGFSEWEGERYFSEIIYDHADSVEYRIHFQFPLVLCFTHFINSTMPHPDFSKLTYIGKGLIDFLPVYHWFIEDRARGITFQVYDEQASTREIKRMDFFDTRARRSESWTFHEFDVSPQDPLLFVIQPEILSVCNSATKASQPQKFLITK